MYEKLLLGLCLTVSMASTSATVIVTGTKDYGGATVGTSCDGQNEHQSPVFVLTEGATLKNVIIKAGGAADGVHCVGNCTLINVKWPDVCEDAATMTGGAGKTMTVIGGSANNAFDKVFQHNGIGSKVSISGFTATNIGKLYRSCGTCLGNGGPRYMQVSNTKITTLPTSGLVVGINSNYGDKATIRTLTVKKGTLVCVAHKGVEIGLKTTKLGERWNDANCDVRKSDITYN